jgi:excisionase family DNA binding protein
MVRDSLELTDREIAASFAAPLWGQRFPSVLTLEQAAELLQVPVNTLYQWRSQERLRTCSRKIGKHVRFYRDRLITTVFNEGLTDDVSAKQKPSISYDDGFIHKRRGQDSFGPVVEVLIPQAFKVVSQKYEMTWDLVVCCRL